MQEEHTYCSRQIRQAGGIDKRAREFALQTRLEGLARPAPKERVVAREVRGRRGIEHVPAADGAVGGGRDEYRGCGGGEREEYGGAPENAPHFGVRRRQCWERLHSAARAAGGGELISP